MGQRRELFAAGQVLVIFSPGVEDLGDDTEATTAVLSGAEHCEQELVGGDARSALELWSRVAAGGQLHHRTHQVDPGKVGVLRFDQSRVDVDEHGAAVAEDQVGREGSVPVKVPAEDLEPPAGVGHRDTRLVAGASACPFGGALVGVKGHEQSVIED